ncbi:MAG: patatin family protein [Lachnospiraceae bacterium]|nr:patatin family protein [Lachnospiraceae bacterium]
MLGIVDVGGGTRDIFGAGVLDYLLDEDIRSDAYIGVSAGSANGASYLAGQRGRNYRFYDRYAYRPEYMSARNFIRRGSYIDLEYIYSTLSNSDGEDPLDYEAFISNPCSFVIVATDAFTGKAVYLDKSSLKKDHYEALMTSSCVPAINKPSIFSGKPYFDGGLSDPIPYDKAFETGCDKVIVILTRPKNAFRKKSSDSKVSKYLTTQYPEAAEALKNRADTYNSELEKALELEKDGRLLIIAPEDISNMKTLTRDRVIMNRMYREGYSKARDLVKDYLKS